LEYGVIPDILHQGAKAALGGLGTSVFQIVILW